VRKCRIHLILVRSLSDGHSKKAAAAVKKPTAKPATKPAAKAAAKPAAKAAAPKAAAKPAAKAAPKAAPKPLQGSRSQEGRSKTRRQARSKALPMPPS
jgi:hypothetical protein